MSLVGLVNLAERLLNQSDSQGQDTQAAQKTSNQPATPATQGPAEDQFTLSQNGQTQATAQDAGLFSVSQFSFFSAAADLLLGQTSTANPAAAAPSAPAGVNGRGAPTGLQNTFASPQTGFGPAAAPPAIAAAQGAVGAPPSATPLAGLLQGLTNANANAANSNTVNAQAPAAAAALTATNGGTTGALGSQQQIQALNSALAALGLDPQQIRELDQIASIIKDFNPALYTALAYQLQALAQQTQQAATPTNTATQGAPANPTVGANGAGANATPAAANANNAGTNGNAAGAAANGGGFQVQELIIKFAAVQGQVAGGANGNAAAPAQAPQANGNGNGNANANVQVAAFNLQIEEVNLTLVNGNGQTAQIQAPAPGAGANPAAAPAPRARTARA